MITNPMARALRNMLIPRDQLFTATVTTTPGSASSQTLSCTNCWWKPLSTKTLTYSGVPIAAADRLLHIPAEQINGSGSPQVTIEIRPRDTAVVNGVNYQVLSAKIQSVSSCWELLLREVE